MLKLRRLFVCLLLLTLYGPLAAMALTNPYIPEALEPWREWVLHDQPERACTLLWNSLDQRRCQWPGRLELTVNNRGGQFEHQWEIEQEGWIQLPGDSRFWPQQVKVNDQLTPVLRYRPQHTEPRATTEPRQSRPAMVKTPQSAVGEGSPVLWLQPGSYRITGHFSWPRLPETLTIPRHTALLALTRHGEFIHQPQVDHNGQLWLNKGNRQAQTEQDHIEFRVFRHLSDSIPAVLTSRIQLQVSGQPRELRSGIMLPQQFIPLALNSPLPARLENDGSLRMQLQPGNWTLELTARHQGPSDQFSLPQPNGPWASQEVWSVQAQPELRVISIEGATAIDPAQTGMPAQWRNLPAFIMTPETTLQLVSRKRGDSDPAAERLQLQRTLWLDFDGSGYTVQDRFSGQLTSSSRLETRSPLQLGRVTSHGQDQFITQLAPESQAGIELRQGQVELRAESRLLPTKIGSLPAVGWQLTPDQLSANLNLPPGWRLLEAAGVDRASTTWLQRWTLLDIFVVLVLALGFSRLWGITSGLTALLALVLIYHEPNAPRLIWLQVLIPIALLRVLPSGRFQNLTQWWRNVALLALLVVVLMFSVQQIRSALYPQLTPQQRHIAGYTERASVAVPMVMEADSEQMVRSLAKSAQQPPKLIAHYDPDLKIQTGPGLPKWQWQQVQLSWNGPVSADQQLTLYLLPPLMTRALLVMGVLLMALMFLRLFSQGPLPRWKGDPPPPAAAIAVLFSSLLLLGSGLSTPAAAQSAYPSPELLDELHSRLTEPESCAPNCAALNQLTIHTDSQRLRLQLNYHSQVASAVPLPFPLDQLTLQSARLNGSRNLPLYRQQQQLWARLPAGTHQLELHASLPTVVQRLQLPMPMAAGMVRLHTSGWKASGIQDGVASHGPIELSRINQDPQKKLHPGEIPIFVRVEREIQLGLDWRVVTTVHRISQPGSAAVITIPLLNGERVTSADVTVKDNNVVLNLPATSSQARWSSSLEKSTQLELVAATSDQFSEVWRLNADRMWHVDSSGIPMIHRYQYGRWLPQWSPWPGEQLILTISRPAGIKGQTVTIDRSELEVTPGKRSSAARLSLTVRSSHGTDHVLTLPDGAELGEVTINGRSQPIKQNKRLVSLPLVPGQQHIVLHWLQAQAIESLTRIPEVHLGSPHVESHLRLKLPANRWILFAGGPVLGPAVLFWGVLVVIVFAAIVLGRYAPTPLRWYHWLLLCAGLSQASLPALLPVVAWLVLLGLRRDHVDKLASELRFNLCQMILVFLSVLALLTILGAIQQGLLGLPEMQIAGNNSSAWDLRWYQDRSHGPLASAWAVTVPMYVYRALMLVWALWLALALLRWLNWGWQSFSHGGLWRKLPPRPQRQKRAARPQRTTTQAKSEATAEQAAETSQPATSADSQQE